MNSNATKTCNNFSKSIIKSFTFVNSSKPNFFINFSPKPVVLPNQVPTNDPATNPESSGTTPPLTIPTVPTISSSATGLLHVYNPTNAQINEFGSWLWTTFSGDLIDTISKLFNSATSKHSSRLIGV